MSRADDTRRRLIAQARVVFAAKGHDGVSVQRDVLEPSGVSNGSFYHQFSDKTDLLVAVLEDAADAARFVLHEAITTTPAADPEQRARRAFETWFAMVDGAEDLFRIQLRERENPDPRVRALIQALRQRWIATIAASLREQTDFGHVDPELTARLIASLTYGVLVDYLDTSADERAALRTTLIDALPRFVAGGVAGLDTPDHPGPTSTSVSMG
jgi:AcrR family transcriptional regulator